jgi:hypothetical protein
MEDKEEKEEKDDSEEENREYMREILQTINRQSLGLASSVAYYNLHQIISNPQEELLKITIGGSKFTGDFETLKKCYLLEQEYWKNLFTISLNASPSLDLQSQNSPPPGFDIVGESSPIKGTVSGSSWDGNNSGVDEFIESDFLFLKNNSKIFSAKNHCSEVFSGEDNPVDQNGNVLMNREGENSPRSEKLNGTVPGNWNDAVQTFSQGAHSTAPRNDAVSASPKGRAPARQDDAVPHSRDDAVSYSPGGSFSPIRNDVVSYRNDAAPRTLEQARKKHNDAVSLIPNPTQENIRSGPKWKTTARKSVLRAQAQAKQIKAQSFQTQQRARLGYDQARDPDSDPCVFKDTRQRVHHPRARSVERVSGAWQAQKPGSARPNWIRPGSAHQYRKYHHFQPQGNFLTRSYSI